MLNGLIIYFLENFPTDVIMRKGMAARAARDSLATRSVLRCTTAFLWC